MKTIEKAVRYLLPGDSVKITSRHKARTVSQVIEFTEKDQVPEEYRTKLLIIWVGCKQWLADPKQVVLVEVPTVFWAMDAGPVEEVDMVSKSALGDLPF